MPRPLQLPRLCPRRSVLRAACVAGALALPVGGQGAADAAMPPAEAGAGMSRPVAAFLPRGGAVPATGPGLATPRPVPEDKAAGRPVRLAQARRMPGGAIFVPVPRRPEAAPLQTPLPPSRPVGGAVDRAAAAPAAGQGGGAAGPGDRAGAAARAGDVAGAASALGRGAGATVRGKADPLASGPPRTSPGSLVPPEGPRATAGVGGPADAPLDAVRRAGPTIAAEDVAIGPARRVSPRREHAGSAGEGAGDGTASALAARRAPLPATRPGAEGAVVLAAAPGSAAGLLPPLLPPARPEATVPAAAAVRPAADIARLAPPPRRPDRLGLRRASVALAAAPPVVPATSRPPRAQPAGRMPLDRATLIGVLQGDAAREALLRLPDGDVWRLVEGDALHGWTVALIGREAVRLRRGNEIATLTMVGR